MSRRRVGGCRPGVRNRARRLGLNPSHRRCLQSFTKSRARRERASPGGRGDANGAWMRRWGAERAGPGATGESEEARQQLGARRAGVERARGCRALKGWGVDVGGRGEGRTGRRREGGSTHQRWNYNLLEERGAGSKSIHSSPTSGADSPQASPSPRVT